MDFTTLALCTANEIEVLEQLYGGMRNNVTGQIERCGGMEMEERSYNDICEENEKLKEKIQRLEKDNSCMMEYNAKMIGSLERAQRIENAYDILLEKYCVK